MLGCRLQRHQIDNVDHSNLTANAQIPEFERQIGQLEDAISILLGDYPHSVARGRPLVDQPIPPEVPAGLPSALLGRRPDIYQAEQNLIAANAEIGVAKAAFFLQIALTGSGGGANGLTDVFTSVLDSNFATWGYGGNFTQPIFEGGQLRGNLRLAKSEERQQLIAYKQAIQGAFRDVSDALIAYEKHHSVRVAQEIAVKDLQESVNTSLQRYRGGITTYLEVLDGQRSLLRYDVFAVDHDRCPSWRAQGNVQHGAVLGDVDLVTAEHRVDSGPQIALLSQLNEQPQCFVCNAVLRVVQKKTVCLRRQPFAALRIVGEELSQMPLVHLLKMRCKGLPRRSSRERFDGRCHVAAPFVVSSAQIDVSDCHRASVQITRRSTGR